MTLIRDIRRATHLLNGASRRPLSLSQKAEPGSTPHPGGGSTIDLIRPRGPLASAKLLVFKTWIPATWSPSKGVGLLGHPALPASVGSANQIPKWRSATGTAGAPGFSTNVSLLKIPVTSIVPFPRESVVRSP